MARVPTFQELKPDLNRKWNEMVIKPSLIPSIDKVARKIIAGKAEYLRVQDATGVPWAVVGCWHNREASCDFKGVLHNGEKIVGTNKKTKLVPAGRGPFATWFDSALDAIRLKKWTKKTKWSIAFFLYSSQIFNGLGYYYKGIPSPYLWSFSNQYTKGKYIADHVFDPNAVDKQMGVAPLMKRLWELDPDAVFGDEAEAEPDEINPDDGLDEGEIASIQQLLRAKKYFSVGRVDGKWGRRTVDALKGFQAAAGLPDTVSLDRAWVDKTTIAALATAPDAQVSAERASTTVSDLKKAGDPVVKTTWWTKVTSKLSALVATLLAAVFGSADSAGTATSFLSPVKELIGDVPVEVWLLLIAGVSFAIWYNTKRTERAVVENVRDGRDAGPA